MNVKLLATFATVSTLGLGLATGFYNSGAERAAIAVQPASPIILAQAGPVVYQENGIAIKGTDPVAYFRQGQPVTGSTQFTYQWGGATWRFSSAENRDLFAANPDRYAPQYGGFCAFAVSRGYTAPIDPNAWTIVDGKLYLNFNQRVHNQWSRDIPGNIAKADRNWPGVLNQ